MLKALRFARCVRHHRAEQLVRRAHRIARNALRERFGPDALFGARAPLAAPPRSSTPPAPIFAARAHLVVPDGDGVAVELLQQRVRLRAPLDWALRDRTDRPLLLAFQLHAMEWVEALDDAAFAAAVSDWIAHAGPRAHARDGWHPFVISLRAVVWTQQLARRRERLAADFVATAERSLAAQIRALEGDLELDLGGNHLLKNLKALLFAGAYFDGPEAARWRRRGTALLERELGEQMLADGLHFERSPAYHAQVVADLLECRALLREGALRTRLDAVLARGCQALADLTHPDGGCSLFNDGGLHMTYAPGEVLDVAERALGMRATARSVFALETAGYFGARRGKSLVVADCGAIGPDHLPAHGHADALAFEWSVAGERLVVDAGVYEYRPGALRDLARSTRSHNTVTLDHHDSCEFWSSFRVGRRPDVRCTRWEPSEESFVLEGTHDGFAHLAGAPIHRRLVRASADVIRVEDRIEGGAGQVARARLLLHPGCRVIREALCAVTIRRGRAAARIVADAPIDVVDAWWFPDFGVQVATKQLVVEYGTAPCEGGMSLRALRG